MRFVVFFFETGGKNLCKNKTCPKRFVGDTDVGNQNSREPINVINPYKIVLQCSSEYFFCRVWQSKVIQFFVSPENFKKVDMSGFCTGLFLLFSDF